MTRTFSILSATALFFSSFVLPASAATHLAQGILVGEVTQNSAIFHGRLTASEDLVEGDVPGATGVGRFEWSVNADFKEVSQSDWLTASADRDFILQLKVTGLRAGTEYHYRLIFGTSENETRTSSVARFKTLPAIDSAAPVNFVLTSCMNYAFFHDRQTLPADPAEMRLGYPTLDAVRALKPDFVIFDGDCVYYDHPIKTRAKTQVELRKKWHEQHVQPRFVQLFAETATYWLKDDHDYRINDGDPAGDDEPSHELGIATFREQVPVTDPQDPKAVTYRTHRVGRDLQLWFVEGRDYRSPNQMKDGPDKSIWGETQKTWLKQSLLESDASFKILVSPTPMVGPDDASKKDNHVNPVGFRHEGEAFFQWLKGKDISPDRFFVICGDRHWKYHSIHPSGYHELTCGALNVENSRMGRAPGDPKSTDPDAKVRQVYTDSKPCGGFLRVHVTPTKGDQGPTIEFIHHDQVGAVLNQMMPK